MTYTTTFSAFGFPMYLRSARRRLVVCAYLFLFTLCVGAQFFSSSSSALYSWVSYAALGVSFIFGGTSRYGLIKPFFLRAPRPAPVIIDAINLHLQPMKVGTPEDSSWQNDERELSRRDLAHYRAYQPLPIVFAFLIVLASAATHPPRWVSPETLLHAIYFVALVSGVASITLPSAIILWTEPDIDAP